MDSSTLSLLINKIRELDEWRDSFGTYELDKSQHVPSDEIETVFDELVDRLKGNYPFHHPQYAGQMLKPPHDLAWAAYALAMTINPNNHALDGGPPSSEMEKEVVRKLAKMAGYGDIYLGHLTSSGTIANLEALWVARSSHPDKGIAYSSAAHYTHQRMCQVLGMQGVEIPVNERGVMDIEALKNASGNIGTVVVTLGTTGMGLLEDLPEILNFCKENNIRVHVDAAYGGFYKLLAHHRLMKRPEVWEAVDQCDSFVTDPHKHGLQPYGCGCVLFKDPAVGKFYKHDSPYTYFSSDDLHLGEISLECSRAGAAAVALWTTLKLFPLKKSEGLGLILEQCLTAAHDFYLSLLDSDHYQVIQEPDLDIVVYFPITDELTTSSITERSRKIFTAGMKSKKSGLHLSLYRMESNGFSTRFPHVTVDTETVTVIRSVLMKPEHRSFIPELMERLETLWKQTD